MRSDVADYHLIAPASLNDALAHLAAGNCVPFAGGTELMVALCAGRLAEKRFVSLDRLGELRFIEADDPAVVRIGSATTFQDIRNSSVLAEELPLLTQTASWTGSIANQNRGTLGGNIANASPAADNPPALLAYDAHLELVSAEGERTVPYRDFHLGYKKTSLLRGELIRAVVLPRRFEGHIQWVRKVGTRNAQAIAKIALAGVARIEEGHIREIALGAASLLDRPARLTATESTLLGQAASDRKVMKQAQDALRSEVAPIDDIRSTARYRTEVGVNLLEQFLEQCAASSGVAQERS